MEHPEIMDLIHKGAGFAQGELVAHGLPPAQVTTLTRGASAAMRALAAGDGSVFGSVAPNYPGGLANAQAEYAAIMAAKMKSDETTKMQNKLSEDKGSKK